MFDTPYDKDGNSKKLIHSQIQSTKKLYEFKKRTKKESQNFLRFWIC